MEHRRTGHAGIKDRGPLRTGNHGMQVHGLGMNGKPGWPVTMDNVDNPVIQKVPKKTMVKMMMMMRRVALMMP